MCYSAGGIEFAARVGDDDKKIAPSETRKLISDAQAAKIPSQDSLSIVSANYVVRAAWAQGYIVDVTVVVDCHNSSRKNRLGVGGFNITFELADGAKVVKFWNVDSLTQDGSVCAAFSPVWHKPVYRGQAVLYFGFETRLKLAPPRRSLSLPTAMTVNGQVCSVSGCFASDLADCRNDYLEEDDDDDLPAQSNRGATPPPEQRDREGSRRRCASAPLVLYRSFGLASPRSRDDDHDSHLAYPPVCTAECWNKDETDDNESTAETVRNRGRRPDSEVKGSKFAVLTPPDSALSACCTPLDATFEVDKQSRKRKFFEEELPDHTSVHCSESSTEVPIAGEHDRPTSLRFPKTLQVDYYRRSKALKKRKYLHMDYLDSHFRSREQVILSSVLSDTETYLEPNMFPYDTPPGVSHWTLWSRKWLQEEEVEVFVDRWLAENLPEALEWNHDDNMADGLSINLFHLHVYVRCPP